MFLISHVPLVLAMVVPQVEEATSQVRRRFCTEPATNRNQLQHQQDSLQMRCCSYIHVPLPHCHNNQLEIPCDCHRGPGNTKTVSRRCIQGIVFIIYSGSLTRFRSSLNRGSERRSSNTVSTFISVILKERESNVLLSHSNA